MILINLLVVGMLRCTRFILALFVGDLLQVACIPHFEVLAGCPGCPAYCVVLNGLVVFFFLFVYLFLCRTVPQLWYECVSRTDLMFPPLLCLLDEANQLELTGRYPHLFFDCNAYLPHFLGFGRAWLVPTWNLLTIQPR